MFYTRSPSRRRRVKLRSSEIRDWRLRAGKELKENWKWLDYQFVFVFWVAISVVEVFEELTAFGWRDEEVEKVFWNDVLFSSSKSGGVEDNIFNLYRNDVQSKNKIDLQIMKTVMGQL